MKRLLGLTFIAIMFSVLLTQAIAINQDASTEYIDHSITETQTSLSSLSEEECIAFIKRHGVAIPNDYDDTTWAPFVKQIIETVENDPEYEFSFNYSVTLNFANAIKDAVLAFHNMSDTNTESISNSKSTASISEYVLQDSIAVTTWVEAFNSFNCYVFSIGIPEPVYVNPGYFSKNSFSMALSVDNMAEVAVADLQALGHQRVHKINPIDIGNLCTNESIICLRRGVYDYHFMRYTNDGWYHKPGKSAILKYKYTPTVVRIWTNERVVGDTAIEGEIIYNSDIVYISYDGHDWEYTSNGSGMQTAYCRLCSNSATTDCNYRYTYLGNNLHSAECVDCGYAIPSISCSISRTSNGDGTHTDTCTTCGHTTTSACDLKYTNLSNSHHKVECSQCSYEVTRELCTHTYTPNSDRTHTVKCTLCTNSYENGCGFTSEYVDPDQHRLNCSRCGKTVLDDCTPENTYCGDETNGDIHAKICPICDHVTEGTSETCTFAYKSNGENTHVYACTQCRYVKSGPVACMFKSDNKCRFCGALKNSAILNAQEEAFSEN